MNYNTMLFCLIMALFMFLVIICAYFFNWFRLLSFLLSLIKPGRTDKEIEQNINFRKTQQYKNYRRKWITRFLIVPVVFSGLYLLISFFTEKLPLSLFVSLILSSCLFEKTSRKAKRELDNIKKSRGQENRPLSF